MKLTRGFIGAEFLSNKKMKPLKKAAGIKKNFRLSVYHH